MTSSQPTPVYSRRSSAGQYAGLVGSKKISRPKSILTWHGSTGTGDSYEEPLLVTGIAEDEEPEKQPLCTLQSDLVCVKKLIFGSWINLLLVFVPIGVAVRIADVDDVVVFFANFLGMIPIASILGDSTECLAEHLGETVGGLLNATFGNAVEIVVMIMALAKAKSSSGELRETLLTVVQTSLIGSIFSNSLLVLGCAFVANGYYHKESHFNTSVTSANVALLMIAAFVMILPGPYAENNNDETDALLVSRAAAIVLMLLYVCLLVFVLYSHKDLMDTDQPGNDIVISGSLNRAPSKSPQPKQNDEEKDDNNIVSLVSDEAAGAGAEAEEEEEEEEEPEPELSLMGSLIVLSLSTIIVAILSEFLVDTLDPMAKKLSMGPAFVGIILLPIIGNAVEHITAIRMAIANKMDIALAIAIGSATQVAMFVVSLAILVAWAMDLDLDLAFNSFEVNLFLYSSIIIFALVSDGSSNWLEGVMLLGLYLLIGIAVWPQQYST